MSSLSLFGKTVTDCFSNVYEVVEMQSNGLCGFNCFAHCFTGQQDDCTNIIKYVFRELESNPSLFIEQTEFGKFCGNLELYKCALRGAVARVHEHSVPSRLWLNDGHIICLSYMFDIAVFVYSTVLMHWVVYNSTGRFGYICLLLNGDHFDVLQGLDSVTPSVPANAVHQGLPRESWHDVNVADHRFTFPFVWQWPQRESMCSDSSVDSTRVTSYADVVKICRQTSSTDASQPTVKPTPEKVVKKQPLPWRVKCTTCSSIFGSNRALKFHCTKVHRVACKETVVMVKHPKDSHCCFICSKVFVSLQSLRFHQFHEHEVSSVNDITVLESQQDLLCAANTDKADIHNASGIVTESENVYTKNRETHTFRCCLCTKQFLMPRALVLHQHRKHGIGAVPRNASSRTNSSSMHAHRKVPVLSEPVTDKFHCAICDRDFDTLRALQIHSSMAHSRKCEKQRSRPHASQAEYRLRQRVEAVPRSTLSRTNSSLEPVMDKFSCMACDREFCTLRGLQIHSAKAHSRVSGNIKANKMQFVVEEEQTLPSNVQAKVDRQKQLGDNCCTNRDLKKIFLFELNKLYIENPPINPNEICETSILHTKLKTYHDELLCTVNNVSTPKVSDEVREVVADVKQIDDVKRKFQWTKEDEQRLNELNVISKTLPVPAEWYWAAKEDSQQGVFNKKRMEFCVEKELTSRIIKCPQCNSTGVLVGLNQVSSSICVDCLDNKQNRKFNDAWSRVQPVSHQYPKRVEADHETEELPVLTVGERAVIAACHPVVTIRRTFVTNKKFKQESISLLQNAEKTWSKILPRNDLKHRFIVVERTFKNLQKRYIIANVQRISQWLGYLFRNHTEYMRMNASNELLLSDEALHALEKQSELAEVIRDEGGSEGDLDEENGTFQAAMESGLSKTDIYTFDKYPNLYLNKQQMVKIKQKGLIEIIEDDSQRRPTYNASANVCFPYLYPNGEMSPLDIGDYKLARDLLKKQSLYAHTMANGSYRWNFAEDSVHMMHQYAKLVEQRVHAMVGFYLTQHPEKVHTPLQSVLKAFRDGINEDGLLDSQLPELSAVMSQIPNTRQKWFSERLGIESISRDLGNPNLFMTLNMDPRAWPDVRQLIYKLEYGLDSEMDRNWFEPNTEKYTELLDKYAPQVCIYLYRKTKIFLRAFLSGICRISPAEVGDDEDRGRDWSAADRYKNSWFWSRVEYTQTRGVQHWHVIAKLPNVLDTALLGRIIHNGRVVRQELKCGNIRSDKVEDAWKMVEMGLLGSRYATLFAESVSQVSFYLEDMDVDAHDEAKVIDIEVLRQQFIENYKDKKVPVSLSFHPIMRRFNDPECDPNENVENAKVVSVSCMHHCIQSICGGNDSGVGCRFSFPKKLIRHTVPAVMQINAEQMEVQMLLRRTCDRVPNLNKYFLRYWKGNHDLTSLISSAQSQRYTTKYISKSKKSNELMESVIDYLGERSNDVLPPSLKQALGHLILADCSHREFVSKHELAYKVMNLPEIQKNFTNVRVIGFYPRASIIENINDSVIVYSDRTEYSAYAERCKSETKCVDFDKTELEVMCFREFAETINYKWKLHKKLEAEPLSSNSKRRFKTRDVNSGYWELKKYRSRRHIRWSTVVYSEPPHMYEEIEIGNTTTQTLYFDLPINKRKQLYRAYYELVCYRPWKNSPEETFLSHSVCQQLSASDPELENRYSLMKLEAFQRVYKKLWMAGEVACAGSQWHRDNQYSYTMYLASLHNTDVRLDRSTNKGVYTARYESADELADVPIELRPPLDDVMDEADVPSVLNFLPPDALRGVMDQDPPARSDICAAFPLQPDWQQMQEMVSSVSKVTLFMATAPSPAISRDHMSFWHNCAIDLIASGKQQVIYIYGKAGTGKTEAALHICEIFKGRVQAGAGTGKAASNFNGPTTHAMFGWAHNEYNQAVVRANEATKFARLRLFYENTDIFVIDEVNAMSAAELGYLDETMHKIFDPSGKLEDINGDVKPFGGKTMVFLGDSAQLRPVCGAAIYDSGTGGKGGRKSYQSGQYKTRTARGQRLYSEYLSKNCIWLGRGFRNQGLLQEILDRVRNGKQTMDDLHKLLYQRRRFPEVQTDHGIHYSNESCTVSNWLDLWNACKDTDPPKRLHISKAGYHTTDENNLIVSGLASIPASQYNFAQDVLCVSEGCEVRLISNLNVSAGLVNSATGTVVKVVYDNADVQALLDGQHPPAYCVIVNFPQFRGFIVNRERKFPFTDNHLVPLYRQKFLPQTLPSWIRKKQVFFVLLPRTISHRSLSSHHLTPRARSNVEESAGEC